MPKCYAVYRILSFECDNDEFARFRVGGVCFPSGLGEFACDLGDLTDSQLEELKNRVGEQYPIRISENLNADQYEHNAILLIKDSNLDVTDEVNLGFMKKEYEKAIGVVAMRLARLKHCINIAENIIRKSPLAANGERNRQETGLTQTTPADTVGAGTANDTHATPKPVAKKKPKGTRKGRVKKYEVAVEHYLIELVNFVDEETLTPEEALRRTPNDIAKSLHTKDKFKKSKKNGVEYETKIESIEQGVRKSKAWKNRKKTLAPLYGDQPPDVNDVHDDWTDKNTGNLDSLNKVNVSGEEYEALVDGFLQSFRNRYLRDGKKTSEQYLATATTLTPEVVATWIKKHKPEFKNRDTESVKNGVKGSMAWINRLQTLDVDAHKERANGTDKN